MPMYYPDLASVKRDAIIFSKYKGKEKYTGIIPQKEEDLPKARKELGKYFREVWNDTIQALEIELAVTEDTYDQKMQLGVMTGFLEKMAQPVIEKNIKIIKEKAQKRSKFKLVYLGRGKGKTTKALKWLKEKENRILIVCNHVMLADLICPNLSFKKDPLLDRIFPLKKFLDEYSKLTIDTEIGIDNLDMMLPTLLGTNNPIKFITLAKE